jgi:enamine deaminase RidA (YjgF/YER057c/UK114 family)
MPIIDSRLKTLGITLSKPAKPVASYVPFTISGNQVFISGQVPISDGALKYVGKLGVDFSVEVGQAAAQLCAINILSVLREACEGNLDRVARCLKVTVFVNATSDYDKRQTARRTCSWRCSARPAATPAPRLAWAPCRGAWR